jgi:hypothetical protein
MAKWQFTWSEIRCMIQWTKGDHLTGKIRWIEGKESSSGTDLPTWFSPGMSVPPMNWCMRVHSIFWS